MLLKFLDDSMAALRASPAARRVWARVRGQWRGTRITRSGAGHVVKLEDSVLEACSITLSGRNNRLEIGAGARLWNVRIRLHGENLLCRVGARCRIRGATFVIEDNGSRLEIGPGTTSTQPMIVVAEGGGVQIGADCMIAYGTDIRNSDGHSILDGAGGPRINPARDVVIGDHVWLGINSQILKGVRIADGAIVAARALVTRDVPARTLVGGVPAKALRSEVAWDRRRL